MWNARYIPKFGGKATLEERLWRRVTKTTSCWLWSGAVCKDGYGRIGFYSGGKQFYTRTHRIAWEITYGEIPPGLMVLHICDTPACCNPAHLRLGTNDDNVADMLAKGRQATGENSGASKLSAEDVRRIRHEYAEGREKYAEIAKRFGVAAATVGAIVTRKTWRHIS